MKLPRKEGASESWPLDESLCRILLLRPEIRWRPWRYSACITTPEIAGYREKAEQTLETFAGVAEQFGIFAATYGDSYRRIFWKVQFRSS